MGVLVGARLNAKAHADRLHECSPFWLAEGFGILPDQENRVQQRCKDLAHIIE
jgi:hypothetical protein